MTEDEKYLFDLNGYLLVKQVLSSEDLKLANEAVDRHQDRRRFIPKEKSLARGSSTLKGEFSRGNLGEPYNWEEPWCLPFRTMLTHPRIIPYLNVILGTGFRQDHRMFVLTMDKGAEGHRLHGSSGPGFDPNQYYIFRAGKMHNGLTVVAFQLTVVNPGDGGLALIPGSHKSNIACPDDLQTTD